MNSDPCLPDKSQIAREILAYLSEHPDAEDTLEGIVQWWLLERKIKYQIAVVKEALADLIKQGVVLECTVNEYQQSYRLTDRSRDRVQTEIGEERNERLAI